MAKIKKYTLDGKEAGEVDIADKALLKEASSQMIKDYIVALRANSRQWSAKTKGRSEVNHSTKKPHPQKGTGNARQGSLASPQYRGGGRVFAPRPKFDQHVRINKKERRAANHYLISQKIESDAVCILDTKGLKEPQTKAIAKFLDALSLKGKRILFLGDEKELNLQKSARNLQKTSFKRVDNLNGYDLALNSHIIVAGSYADSFKTAIEGVQS